MVKDGANGANAQEPPTKFDVKYGDILLFRFIPPQSPITLYAGLLEGMCTAVEFGVKVLRGEPISEDERMAAMRRSALLLHWTITRMDNSDFSHAAIIGKARTGEISDPRVVIEAGPVTTNHPYSIYSVPLAEYAFRTVIDVVRYKNGDVTLGDPELPAEPVLEAANRLIDRQFKTFGYDNALVLIFVCAARHLNSLSVHALARFMGQHLGPSAEDLVLKHETLIAHLINAFALAMAEHVKNPDSMVCSQAVTAAFITADGDYPIKNPDTDLSCNTAPPLDAPLEAATNDTHAAEEALAELAACLSEAEAAVSAPLSAASTTDITDLLQAVQQSDLLTPGQLFRSVNTCEAFQFDGRAPVRSDPDRATEPPQA